uniref:Uncharacterized protein n=1 Tax=Tanacetum cinerariifolium TaxID=118510 RepID=A0A699IHQ6_TANCI|nr:hypothetical protein [Tanacetum cinerariifolium]
MENSYDNDEHSAYDRPRLPMLQLLWGMASFEYSEYLKKAVGRSLLVVKGEIPNELVYKSSNEGARVNTEVPDEFDSSSSSSSSDSKAEGEELSIDQGGNEPTSEAHPDVHMFINELAKVNLSKILKDPVDPEVQSMVDVNAMSKVNIQKLSKNQSRLVSNRLISLKTSKWFKKSPRPDSPDPVWSKDPNANAGQEQDCFPKLEKTTKDPKEFDDLLGTTFDFSNFVKDRLKKDKLTKADLEGPTDLAVALRFFIRRTVLNHRVKDVQLGVESYQTKLNLTIPYISVPSVESKEPYTIFYNPRGVIYESRNGNRCLMGEDEVYKFGDDTIMKVRDELKYSLNNFGISYNKDMRTRPWSEKDQRRTESMLKVIEKRLHTRRIIRSLEC